MRWIISQGAVERAAGAPTGRPSLASAAREAGHEVHVVPFQEDCPPGLELEPIAADLPVMTYGGHRFVDAVMGARPDLWPGAWHRTENLACSVWARQFPDLIVNQGLEILTWAEARDRDWRRPMFVRPDAVTKAFAGGVMALDKLDTAFAGYAAGPRFDPQLPVVVAEARPILGEFRFFIVAGEVVTGSCYRWAGRMDVRIDTHPACAELAAHVAGHPWQADTGYVCDVALMDDGQPRIMELNSFSSAGLYACDTRALVRAVACAVALEPPIIATEEAPGPEPE
ncbi:ATP-grasp domain-containing protein [Cereibacter sphaeroides]|uniref:ATP-grasp domain-containing protein n=1 Tax=Cereibacter sphaeroides TaxID=1063 RepID=UPI001F3B17FF|nr:ATP-grasp domain-containing protein [Cereibacter sphaeroides]MCE6958078.1 ATP-grasp domain-containing protein [Cereibacter sphaeroides]MCE6971311.1 ATP-grasp domain-containing protein [Cereibacter sphaeroides]